MGKTGSMTMQELDRAKVVEACVKGEIRPAVAALRLGITTRQLLRLRQRFAEAGADGMISGHRGKRSNRQLRPGLAQQVLEIVRERYADYGPTLACEQLVKHHDIALSKEKLRQLMIAAGLWTPRADQPARLHQPRERRNCLGELIQIDGSRHHWFEQRGPACALLAYVDDATGRIMQLHFAETESTASYFEATRSYIERHGLPRAFYADRAAVFRSPATNRRVPTQFQRALDELGIELICANSPQAKGRVERVNRTLQDRLVKELRMNEIASIDAANAWCDQFMEDFNQHFGCLARSQIDLHMPVRAGDDLQCILAMRDERKLSTKLTLQHGGQLYLLKDRPGMRELIGRAVAICTYADGRVELRANGTVLPYETLAVRKPASVEVNSKTLHQVVDQLGVPKTPSRDRHYRDDQPPRLVAQGVRAAKKAAAQKRVQTI